MNTQLSPHKVFFFLSLFLFHDRVILLLDLVDVDHRFRKFHIQGLQRLADDPGDGEVAEPFVVRGNNKPGGMFGAALAQRSFERCAIGVPDRIAPYPANAATYNTTHIRAWQAPAPSFFKKLFCKPTYTLAFLPETT